MSGGQVIMNGPGVEIPAEVAKLFGSDAPAYLIIDPKQGQAEVEAELELRNNYKKGACIIFTGNHKLADGRIVYVGEKIDPMLAHMNLTSCERDVLFGGNRLGIVTKIRDKSA